MFFFLIRIVIDMNMCNIDNQKISLKKRQKTTLYFSIYGLVKIRSTREVMDLTSNIDLSAGSQLSYLHICMLPYTHGSVPREPAHLQSSSAE